eukprot:7347735-Pyramimonas_sp.AAC.1
MTIAKVKRAKEAAIDEVGRSLRLHNEHLVTSLMSESFSYQASKRSTQFVPTSTGDVVSVTIGRRSTNKRDVARLLVSHAAAQARGIREWLESGPCTPDCLVFANTFDDASMWASKPSKQDIDTLVDTAPRDAARSKLKRGAPKGIMRHCPVLNLCETIAKCWTWGAGPAVSAARVCSPAQVMPAANYSTVLDRWRRWSICNDSGRPGSSVDSDG